MRCLRAQLHPWIQKASRSQREMAAYVRSTLPVSETMFHDLDEDEEEVVVMQSANKVCCSKHHARSGVLR